MCAISIFSISLETISSSLKNQVGVKKVCFIVLFRSQSLIKNSSTKLGRSQSGAFCGFGELFICSWFLWKQSGFRNYTRWVSCPNSGSPYKYMQTANCLPEQIYKLSWIVHTSILLLIKVTILQRCWGSLVVIAFTWLKAGFGSPHGYNVRSPFLVSPAMILLEYC